MEESEFGEREVMYVCVCVCLYRSFVRLLPVCVSLRAVFGACYVAPPALIAPQILIPARTPLFQRAFSHDARSIASVAFIPCGVC